MANIVIPNNKDLEIYEMNTTVSVRVEGLEEEVKKAYLDDDYDLEEYVVDNFANVDDTECIDYSYYEFDELIFKEFLHQILNTNAFDKFLVISYSGTWNNATGYRFNNYDEVLFSNNEHNIYHVAQNKGTGKYKNKVNLFKNYHHDRPMGHDWLVIGLTKKQYEKLVDREVGTFDDILEYAKPYYEEIKKGLENKA